MDVHSSSCWGEVVKSEIRTRKDWIAKYGAMYPDPLDEELDNESRPATGMNSRPATGMSQSSQYSANGSKSPKLPRIKCSRQSPNKEPESARQTKLHALRQKLMNALHEVDGEISDSRGRSSSRSRSRAH